MDRKVLGLAMALAYPQYAFAGEDDEVIADSRALVARAGRGEAVTPEVTELLSRHRGLDDWVDDLLADPGLVPRDLQPHGLRSFRPLPGDMGVIEAPRFTCSSGDGFTWYQISAADPVPPCMLCGRPLVRD
jgi:hypothetical protein